MIYYFSDRDEYAYLKEENLDEYDSLVNIPFVHKNKMKSVFLVRFQYLIDLSKRFKLKPQEEKDRDHLKKLFERIKWLKNLSNENSSSYPYESFLNPDSYIKPRDFQKVGADFLVAAKRCILADDVGLGKTIQTILALCRLIYEKHIQNSIMIVSPASIKFQWKNEFLEHPDVKRFPEFQNIVVVQGSRKERELLYKLKKKIYIVNYEQFIHDFDLMYDLSFYIDAIVLDEASKIKNPSAQRSKKIKTLMQRVPYKFLLTATPIENKLYDLYSLYNFIDPTIFTSFQYFERLYCIYQEFRLGRFGPRIKKLVGYQNIQHAKVKIAGSYIRRTTKMVGVQLPQFIVQLRLVELFPEQRELYDKVKGQDYEVKMKQIHLLHQICNDPEQLDETMVSKSAKIAELLHLVEDECSNDKIIVFSFYRRFTNIIFQKLKKYNPLYIHGGTTSQDRERFKQMFNKMDKYRIMIMTSAGEYGIDLPAASVLVNMDLPENPSRLKQRCGRPRRMSSKHETIRIINILAKDTIEEKTVNTIFKKMDLFTAFFSEDNPDLVSGGSFYAGLKHSDLRRLF